MFAKLVALVVCIAACACTLLATRQARVQAAHELADARLRVMQRDNDLWRTRADIASLVTPEHVRIMAAGLGPMQPMLRGLRLASDLRSGATPVAAAPPAAPPRSTHR